MRVLGFSQRWPKLKAEHFTTFRYPRRDRDWREGEEVQIVLHPRSPNREALGIARITRVRPMMPARITNNIAKLDGFNSAQDMRNWLYKTYRLDVRFQENNPINRLTLVWVVNEAEELADLRHNACDDTIG